MLTMAAGKGQGYIGQGLGIADILAALYFHEMKYDPQNPRWEDRDRFILSTGHYSIATLGGLGGDRSDSRSTNSPIRRG